ncbi:MAG TPA: helix-turn-helix domain-containing protein [Methylomirabilota bacterium]|jgi:excisionase family DNA binding protein|nr:helix-turn-helix domain-containing protein [Methylomirabilota bacterium]
MQPFPSVPRAPLLLTVPDTARRLRRHEQTIRAMIRRGDLAAVRLGRLIRVLATAVDRASEAMGSDAVRPRTPRRSFRRIPARARA